MEQPQLDLFKQNRYHRSTEIRDKRVIAHREKVTAGQDAIILEFLKLHCMESFSAPQLFRILSPLHPEKIRREGSVRRSLSNLSNQNRDGRVIMLDDTEEGEFGRENHKYQYAGKPSINQTI